MIHQRPPDGYIGFEHEVVGEIWRGLVPGARVHAVGVGSAAGDGMNSRVRCVLKRVASVY